MISRSFGSLAAGLGTLVLTAVLGTLSACGSEDGAATSSDAPDGGSASKAPTTPPGSVTTDASTPDTTDPWVGLWTVEGSDARGKYTGEVEVRPASGSSGVYTFIRNVRYAGVTVEGGRDLYWLFRGTLTKSGSSNASLTSSLKRLDFITQRGSVTRSANDGPIALSGSFALKGDVVTGSISGGDVSLSDTWRARKALPASPIFEDQRTIVPAHDPPSSTSIQTSFALYSNYHGLDVIKPYVNRPEFKAAVHGHVIDTTDLAFYRKNPTALRVVDKVIDDVSLGETRARADAYRYTLAKKAELYDQDIETRFIDPAIGMIPDNSTGPGAGFSGQGTSGDSSLWTGIYLAGQVYRAEITGSVKAKDNVVHSLNALLTLQEITGDWSKFARTLRKATGNPQPPWHAGTGAYSQLEWLEGGNNDMIKGLFYGYLMGWELLCENGKTGYETYCARIRTNAKHLADDIVLAGSNSPAAQLTNKLPAAWLAAVVAEDIGDKLSYQTKANGYWTAEKAFLTQTAESSFQGQVDASGMNLGSVGDTVTVFLAQRMNLGGDAVDKYRAYIDLSYGNIGRFRLPEWDLLAAIAGTGAGTSAAAPRVTNAVSRLQEAMYPKVSYNVDHRIDPEFCMSPYPYQPWKNDWMQYPQTDRTSALNSYPLFEVGPDVLYWKVGNSYRSSEGYEAAGGDYLHLYWQARKFGLITATD